MSLQDIGLDAILGDGAPLATTRTSGEGPHGHLPIDARMLREAPSGDLFGLTQNAGMGWRASEVARAESAADTALAVAAWRFSNSLKLRRMVFTSTPLPM